MQIQVTRTGGDRIEVSIGGEMTIFHANEFKQELLASLAEANEMDLDLGAVEDIDTSGLQVLVLLKTEAINQQKTLRLAGHSQAVVDLLDISNLTGFFGDPVLLQSNNH